MNALPWIITIIVLLAVIYFISKTTKEAKTVADATVAAIAAPQTIVVNTAPNCIPFTQAQQNQEKLAKIAKERCDMKALIPIVGPKQFSDCIKAVNASLTPVNTCQ